MISIPFKVEAFSLWPTSEFLDASNDFHLFTKVDLLSDFEDYCFDVDATWLGFFLFF